MKWRMWFLLLALISGAAGAADEWSLSLEEWLRPRSGERVVRMPALSEAVRAWHASPSAVLVVRYPGGEEGVLWAEELRSWVVGLGVPSAAVRLEPGSPRTDRIVVAVRERGF